VSKVLSSLYVNETDNNEQTYGHDIQYSYKKITILINVTV
jgi:hypothetical protein